MDFHPARFRMPRNIGQRFLQAAKQCELMSRRQSLTSRVAAEFDCHAGSLDDVFDQRFQRPTKPRSSNIGGWSD